MVKVIVEKSKTGFSAYSPDVDGCVATGRTSKEALDTYLEALKFHKEGLEEDDKENI